MVHRDIAEAPPLGLRRFQRFGYFGPAYEVLGPGHDDAHVRVRVLESGEEFEYRLENARTDPDADAQPDKLVPFGGAENLPRRGFDLDEIRRMMEIGVLEADERFELIDGEIVPMSAQGMPHIRWRSKLVRWLNFRVAAPIEVAPEATLVLSRRPARSFETDILLYTPREAMREINPADVRLAIEISDTTRQIDLTIKAPRYGAFGVGELWVLDLESSVTYVHREPDPAGYGAVTRIPFAEGLTPLFEPSMRLVLTDIAP